MTAPRCLGVLLLGPTGAGKTPLGEMLQRRGLWGVACRHFDFGDHLRRLAAQEPDGEACREDIEFVRAMLARGALLEDKDFPLAERILRRFLAVSGEVEGAVPAPPPCPAADNESGIKPSSCSPRPRIVLNGLPRHVGQAAAIEPLIHVDTVLQLVASGETVLERIRRNTGGDREGRADDDLASVQRKLTLYAARTAPLVDHYRGRGCRMVSLEISPQTTAADAWAMLHA